MAPPPSFSPFTTFGRPAAVSFSLSDANGVNTERGVIQDLMVEGIKGVEGTGINPIP